MIFPVCCISLKIFYQGRSGGGLVVRMVGTHMRGRGGEYCFPFLKDKLKPNGHLSLKIHNM